MAIMREYECGDCGSRFEKLHFDRSEPAPECPGCQALQARQVPSGFSIGGGNASKAADITFDICSKDLGMTDLKDNLRVGDVAAPNIPSHLAPAAQQFWNASGPIIAAAKQGAGLARAEGRNPLTMVQRARKLNARS